MKQRALVIAIVAGTAWLLILAGQRAIRTSSPAPTRAVVVSTEEFGRIQPGMSYQDCVRVIGVEGAPYGSSDAPEAMPRNPEWISYVWRNSEDSYITVSFHNGRVERTRAFNLE